MPSSKTQLRRLPQRASYDREQLNQVLDEGLLCHLGFSVDGQPFVIPTLYCRAGDRLLIHGSAASRTLRALDSGLDACICVTLVDGLVLARAAFHHSMNYRSAMIFGRAVAITDREEKLEALRAVSEHVIPGRWKEVRMPHEKELKATSILTMEINEFSLKIRTGPPLDDEEDYGFPVWAGVLPFQMKTHEAIRDPRQPSDGPVPDYIKLYTRRRS